MCSIYMKITLLRLPGKVSGNIYTMELENTMQLLVKPRIQEDQASFILAYPLYQLENILMGLDVCPTSLDVFCGLFSPAKKMN